MNGCSFNERRDAGYANLRTKIYFDLRGEVEENSLHFGEFVEESLISEVEVELFASHILFFMVVNVTYISIYQTFLC